MHRFLVCLLLLALGALTAVVVAWRFEIVYPMGARDNDIERTGTDIASLWESYAIQPTLSSTHAYRWQNAGRRSLRLSTESDIDRSSYRFYSCDIEDRGWPWPCLRRQAHYSGTMTTGTAEHRWSIDVNVGRTSLHLPWHPLWITFALDTVIYAGMILVAVRMIATVRRRDRLDRGRCPRCAYRLSAPRDEQATTCSECGCSVSAACRRRPRQILRWWMAAPMAAPACLGLLWLGAGSRWSWTVFQIRYVEPILVPDVLVPPMVVAWFWILVLCESSYRDRPAVERHVLSFVVSTVLSTLAYVSVYIGILRVVAMVNGYA